MDVVLWGLSIADSELCDRDVWDIVFVSRRVEETGLLVAIRVRDIRVAGAGIVSGSDAIFTDSPAFAASSLIVLAARRTVPERAATRDAGLEGGGMASASRTILRSEGSIVLGFATSLCDISLIALVRGRKLSDSSASGVPVTFQSLTVET